MTDNNIAEIKTQCAVLLQSMIDGKMTPQQVRDKWPFCKDDKDIDVAFHLTYHFEDDQDIRNKDHKYAIWQIEEIRKTIDMFNPLS